MTLARRITWSLLAMLAALVLLAGAALWGLAGLSRNLQQALAQYQTLRLVYEAGLGVMQAREQLEQPAPDHGIIAGKVGQAIAHLDQCLLLQQDSAGGPELGFALRSARAQLAGLLADDDGPAAGGDLPPKPLVAIHQALGDLARASVLTKRQITAIEHDGSRRLRTTTISVAGLAGIILLAAAILAWWHYRSIMRPLRRVFTAMEQLAAGRLQQRLPLEGDAELVALAQRFNATAGELQELCQQLETRVQETSKELVRSERLASVGFLAAGLAHEINTPLGIIAGYAQLSLKQLQSQPPAAAGQERLAQTFTIINEEAFRCKQIIEKLLTLSRPGSDHREKVALEQVVADVVAIAGALAHEQRREILCDLPALPPPAVLASSAEMKQVLLNLISNGLEATDPERGQIRIALRWLPADPAGTAGSPTAGALELSVCDNGRGMSAEQIERVFEPFYTHKRGGASPGAGLGLAIVHGIVVSHGGTIRAGSGGPGQGSTFTVRLPAAGQEARS